ncbi:MAG: FtsW/RodA/SpoVE family cell cycle protein [Chloroflexi bacterium]|nr:FtsW/RodA/SpoVE family cell cycle protein [Chloroflexota bacterium]
MTDQTQGRLLKLAAIFLGLYAVILTLSPAVRERSWDVDYRWAHWLGLFVWIGMTWLAHRATAHYLPDRDPYLLPIASLLSGWGLLTIWRLTFTFGLRQTIWLAISVAVFVAALRLRDLLAALRRYKYLWLTGGLILTALTLFFGSNPAGIGPRLWLSCCGVYFQPSEPLKLLLVIYLAAYLADRMPLSGQAAFPLIFPTILLTGLALLLLLVQRDLGTASIFIVLYAIVLYLAAGRKRVLLVSAAALGLAGLLGYRLIDIVRLRLDAWLNPWGDPSGRAYQIVQSLLAIANGGLWGRGPGLGNPGFVPVAHSDFIFAAIAEEAGLIGTIGLLALLGIFLARGLHTALRAPNKFRRLLAAGLTTYLGTQSLLIIGGNERLLPLTGVTLPFVSYGGSSLLTSYLALLILITISGESDEPAPLPAPQPYLVLGGLLGIGLAAAAVVNGWWAVVRGPELLTRTDNPRRALSDRYVPRGALLDRSDTPISITRGETGGLWRDYQYPDLAPVTGYAHPVYGLGGLEARLDDYLRGLDGNPATLTWWHHLLYGQPPPGLDVRLSLDLDLQARADTLLGGHAGAVVLLNAQNGEILVMASHPTFDPNTFDENGETLLRDPDSPLLNRAALGSYPLGGELAAVFGKDAGSLAAFGLTSAPQLRLQVAAPTTPNAAGGLRVSPLQMALAAAALSNGGTVPAPRIALAVNTPQSGWVILPALGKPLEAVSSQTAERTAQSLITAGKPYWQILSSTDSSVTWLLTGTPPDWGGASLTLVVLLEEENHVLAESIGQGMLEAALGP